MPKQCHLTPPSLLRHPSQLTQQAVAEAAVDLALQIPIDDACTPLKQGLLRLAPQIDLDEPWVKPAMLAGGVGLVYVTGTEVARRYGLPSGQTLHLGPLTSQINLSAGPRFTDPSWSTTTQLRLASDKLTLRYAGGVREPVRALGVSYNHGKDLSLSADWKQKSGLTGEAALKLSSHLRVAGSYAQQGNQWQLAVSGSF